MNDPFEMIGEPLPRPSKAAEIRWRLKGNTDGPVYQGQQLMKPCVGCGNGLSAAKVSEREFPDIEKFALDDEPTPAGAGTWVVYTLAFGNPDWMAETLPTIRDWTARHDLPFVEWSRLNPDYPAEKFVEVDMVRDFLERDEEWMMYVDLDMMIHPRAPHPACAARDGQGIYLCDDRPGRISRSWAAWVKQHFNRDMSQDYVYQNAGVWIIDRATAARFLEVAQEPFIEAIQEQHQFNLWVHDMGDLVKVLHQKWNTMGTKMQSPSWFYHIAGNRKSEKIQELRERGFLPNPFPQPNWKLWKEQ